MQNMSHNKILACHRVGPLPLYRLLSRVNEDSLSFIVCSYVVGSLLQ